MIRRFLITIIFLSIICQLACATRQSKITRFQAIQTSLDCAQFAAEINGNADLLAQVAIKYAEAGNFNRAVELIESLPEKNWLQIQNKHFIFQRPRFNEISAKIEVLTQVAILQAKGGNQNQAQVNLERAVSLLQIFKRYPDYVPSHLIGNVVSGFVVCGNVQRAFFLASTLPDEFQQAQAANDATQYDPQEANQVTARSKITLLILLAENLALLGQQEKCLEIILVVEQLFAESGLKSIDFTELLRAANIYVQLGNRARAESVLSHYATIERAAVTINPAVKPDSLAAIAVKFIELDFENQGLALLQTIHDPQTKAIAIVDAIEWLLKKRNYVTALALSQQIPASEMQFIADAKSKIATQYCDDKQLDESLALIAQIEEKETKANRFAYVAHKYFVLGNQVKARELATLAFETSKATQPYNGMGEYYDFAEVESIVQYCLLVDQNFIMEKLKEVGRQGNAGGLLQNIAEKFAQAGKYDLAITVLDYIQAEDNLFDHESPISVEELRSGAIAKISLHYYDTKRPVTPELQLTLAELIKRLG